jgi:hypothetical protein
MKAKICLGVLALALSAPALALTPAVTASVPASNTFFIAGATAQKNTIPNMLGGAAAQTAYAFAYPQYTAICAANSLDIFYDPAANGLTAGSNYRAYSCTLAAAASLPTGLKPFAGQNIVIHYRLLSGSWIGVGPLSRGQPVTRMAVVDDGTCAAATKVPAFPLSKVYNTPSYICSGTTTAVPDIGLSDQEPGIFFGQNAPNDGNPGSDPTAIGITAADLLNITTAPLQGVLMNIIGSRQLINAMQKKQSLPIITDMTRALVDSERPSISSPQITSLLTANGGPYNTDWQPVVGPDGAGFNIGICRRISAVGTQIAANAFWLNYPCSTNALVPAVPSDSTPTYTVIENNLIADCRVCVKTFNTKPSQFDQYAIGLLFTDNSPSSEQNNWDFLKIDGIDPNVPNAVSGAYRFVTVETWQYRKNVVNGAPALTGTKLSLAKAIFAELEKPVITAQQSGFLSLLENGYTPGVQGNNIWPGSVTTTGPHICTPPIFYF